jgi:hypothetical protein
MDMNAIVNEFITRGDSKRRNAFALLWLWLMLLIFAGRSHFYEKSWDWTVLFSKVFRTNSFTRNHLSCFRNALKLTWGKVEMGVELLSNSNKVVTIQTHIGISDLC